MPFIVLVNDLGDHSEPQVDDTPAPVRFFIKQFPKADVEFFDLFNERAASPDDRCLREVAKGVIQRLQRSADAGIADGYGGDRPAIVFVAHNAGAVLVKQVLLLASEDYRHQWISHSTVALYLVESPLYTNHCEWEQCPTRLHATNRMRLESPAALLNVPPRALTNVEVQFSAIRDAYDIRTFYGPCGGTCPPSEDPWYFEDDGSRMDAVLHGMRASLRRTPIQLRREYQLLQQFLSRPEASISRVPAVDPDRRSMTWLENHASFQSWLGGSGSAVLGVTGPPGSGSTHFSSHILHLLLSRNPDTQAVFLSFSFCRWDARRTSERNLVTSLIRQLLTLRPGLFGRVTKVSEHLLRQPPVSCTQLWALFRHLLTIPSHPRVFLVLNAADQCLQSIASILRQLATITSAAVPLKIVTTSFKPLDMPLGVSFRGVSLRDAGWAQAIRNMAAERAARIVEMRPVWKGRENDIVKKLCNGDCAYLHVVLNLKMLEHSKIPSTRDALRQQLMTPVLPIEKAFGTLVSGLHESELARLAINWIYYAARPLTVRELAVALALGPDPTGEPGNAQRLTFEILAETVSWDLLQDLSSNLGGATKVVDDRVFLIHSTLRDYLKEHSNLLVPNFHATIAGACLSYMSLHSEYSVKAAGEDQALELPRHMAVASAFLEYAELYWVVHYKLVPSPSQPLDDKVTQILALCSDTSEVADRTDSELSDASDASDTPETWATRCRRAFGWKEDAIGDPLLLAAQLELGRVVNKMLAENSTSIAPESVEKAASIAARTGNLATIQALLRVAGSSALPAALEAAAEYGHAGVVEQLVARLDAADAVSLRSTRDADSPLLLAASNGHTEVVRVLLAQGLSMQASDLSGNTPVHLASAHGDVSTLKVLRELGPDDFNEAMATENGAGRYPIHLACEAGFIEAFDLLLSSLTDDQLAQVTRVEAMAMNAVQLAAESGHAAILTEFITAGVDVVRGYTTVASTPLFLAARNGHYDAVVCLVQELEKLLASVRDSEATTSEPQGQEPWRLAIEESLDQAVMEGHENIVRFLIPKPLLRNTARDWDRLCNAVTWGRLDIVETLVGAGISVETESKYNPILNQAIFSDSPDIVRLLLNEGLAPQRDDYETSLHYATRIGHRACLREMLRAATGDDLREKDRNLLTPLEIAARSGHVDAFMDLLACEEKLRAPSDQPRRSPKALLLAVQSPLESKVKTEFVRFLLDNRWKAGAPNGRYDFPLHAASAEGQDDVVELLLSRDADPNARDGSHRTALHSAVAGERASTVAILLHRANPNLVDNLGFAPLHMAAKEGAETVVRVLLGLDGENDSTPAAGRAKADVELPGPGGWRALHYAHASSAVARCLLEADPAPRLDAVADGRVTPLILAAGRGAGDVVRQLLDAGAKRDELDSEGRTALHHVAGRRDGDHPDSAKCLLEYKADPNIVGTNRDQPTPLYAAIVRENKGVARVLLDAPGINPNLYGGALHSPLQAAASLGDVDMVTRLLKAGADAQAQGGSFGSPLHAAAWVGSAELVAALLRAGASARLETRPFGAPLHALLVVWNWRAERFSTIATLLVNQGGADVNAALDRDGHSSLMLASARGPAEDVQTLLDLGADPNAIDLTGATPLHGALRNPGRGDVARHMLAKGANAAARDGCGRDALYLAAMSASDDLVTFTAVLDAIPAAERASHLAAALPAALKARATAIFEAIMMKDEEVNVNVQDRSGWTALDVANCYGMLRQVEMLEKRAASKGATKEEPTRLSLFDRDCKVSDDGMEAGMDGCGIQNVLTAICACAVRANHCIPMDKGVFYFEAEVLECVKDFYSTVAVGLVQEVSALGVLCGWLRGTWGYHSDDGSILTGNDIVAEAPAYRPGQVVGVTFDPSGKKLRFTLDGNPVGEVLENVVGQLYPAVSFQGQPNAIKVRVSFGVKDGNGLPFKHKPVMP